MRIRFALLLLLITFHLSSSGQDQASRFNDLDLLSDSVCSQPALTSCETDSLNTSWSCTLDEIVNLITSNLKYPGIARENDRQGTALIQLIINSEGNIVDCQTLHHFGVGTEKALSKMYKKSRLNELQFNSLGCLKEGKFLHLKIPVTFKLEGGHYSKLWDIEQIFCERTQHFSRQFLKVKRLKKELEKAKELNEFWIYKHGLLTFRSFDMVLHQAETKHEWKNITDLKSSSIDEMIALANKDDVLIFNIHDTSSKGETTFKKAIKLY